ncbi:MAG: hypothetical protein JWL73_3104 [Actinomycetia bacterium]|nr:hypothetical protein [Actinomycetes bacterium]
MRRVRQVAVAVMVAMAATVAAPMASGATTAASTSSTKTARIKAAKISVKYPRGWTVAPLTKSGIDRIVKSLATKNPKLAAVLSNTDLSQFKFFAIDPTATTFASNINVQSVGGGTLPTLADFTNQVQQAYTSAGGTFVGAKAMKINGKTAYRTDALLPIKAADGTTITAHEGQLFIARGGASAVVTVSSTNDPTGSALIDRIIAGVRLI